MRGLLPILALSAVFYGCSSSENSPRTGASAEANASPAKASILGKFQPNGVVVDHDVKMLDGTDAKLSDYRGKALLVVNTASECGFTPQYAGLQEVYAKFKDQGFEVLAFPSNDFGAQEPGDASEIRTFVDENFAVTFPMFDKVHAKGPEKSPLFQTLTEKTGEGIRGEVEWNFTKFLVDPQGRVVARFGSDVDPTSPEVVAAIEQVLPSGGA